MASELEPREERVSAPAEQAVSPAVWVRGPDPSLARRRRPPLAGTESFTSSAVEWVPISALGHRARAWAADNAARLPAASSFGRPARPRNGDESLRR
jgi:hypothetical protein